MTNNKPVKNASLALDKTSLRYRAKADWRRNSSLYLLFIPVIVFYILFHYKPMYGAIIAFKDFSPGLGIMGSPWVGLKHFKRFFQGAYFGRLMRNTIVLSVYELVFGFPAPIILALLLNEVRNKFFKRSVQTLSYLPHFISLVVICGMILDFSMTDGLFNDLAVMFGGTRSPLLLDPGLYRRIYVISSVWQSVGWGSVIFVAALSGVDMTLYEAAEIDGAGRFKQLLYVTLPSIAPTIIIMLILRVGNLFGMGYEKTILLYNQSIYETADVISSYVYREGILRPGGTSYSTAVGLFNSVINFSLLLITNRISKKVSETSLW